MKDRVEVAGAIIGLILSGLMLIVGATLTYPLPVVTGLLAFFTAFFLSYRLGWIVQAEETEKWRDDTFEWQVRHARVVHRLTKESNQWRARLEIGRLYAHQRGAKRMAGLVEQIVMHGENWVLLPDWFFEVENK